MSSRWVMAGSIAKRAICVYQAEVDRAL